MTVSAYPSIESDLFGATGDLPAAINTAHHNSGFPSSVPPDRKQLNKELNRLDQGMNYLLQGFPEFQVGQSYAIGRLIANGSKIYKSLLNQTAAAGDLTNIAKWTLLIDLSAASSTVGIAAATVTKSTTSIIALTEKSILSGANNITLTLPAIAGVTDGDIYYVKSLHTGVKIDANGAETIDGISQSINLNKYDAYSFRAAATDWQICSDHINERGYATDVITATVSATLPSTQKNTLLGANNLALVMPTIANVVAGEIFFIKTGNFTGCTLDAGANTIDGSALTLSLSPYSAYTLQKTSATNWQIVSFYSTAAASSCGISTTQKTVGASTTLTATDKFAKLTAANIATTLPLLSTVQVGDIFVIKNGNFFGNTVVPQGANTIDGVAGAELLMPYEMMQLRASVGLTEWEKI